MPPFLQNLLALPAKTKALLGVSAVAILAIAFVMLKIATAPSYALIACGPRSRRDRQDHRRARRAGHRLRAAQQRHGAGRHEVAVGAGADRARRRRACRPRAAARSPATSCSTSPSSAPPSSSSRSPTSARWRVRSPARCPASRACSNPTVRIVLPQDDLFQDEATAATAAVMLGNPLRHAGAGRRARHGAGRRLVGQGPQERERHDHRLHRPGPVALRRGRRLDVGRRHQAERRGALRPPDGDAR